MRFYMPRSQLNLGVRPRYRSFQQFESCPSRSSSSQELPVLVRPLPSRRSRRATSQACDASTSIRSAFRLRKSWSETSAAKRNGKPGQRTSGSPNSLLSEAGNASRFLTRKPARAPSSQHSAPAALGIRMSFSLIALPRYARRGFADPAGSPSWRPPGWIAGPRTCAGKQMPSAYLSLTQPS